MFGRPVIPGCGGDVADGLGCSGTQRTVEADDDETPGVVVTSWRETRTNWSTATVTRYNAVQQPGTTRYRNQAHRGTATWYCNPAPGTPSA